MKLIKVFIKYTLCDMKYNGLNLFQAVKEECDMMLHVMGIDLYVKYGNGTAVEGVDFFIS